jgi:hypothetical protein
LHNMTNVTLAPLTGGLNMVYNAYRPVLLTG